jgi:uncharacterized OsmC-like protein
LKLAIEPKLPNYFAMIRGPIAAFLSIPKSSNGPSFSIPGERSHPALRGIRTMNAEELKAIQAPLKDRYRQSPETAMVTLKAEGRLGEGVTCKLDTFNGPLTAGLHPATGGPGLEACSGDMLLEALVACAGVTLKAVATALGINLRDATLHAEGDVDFRGTLGVSKEVPIGFQKIRLRFVLDTDAPQEKIDTLIRLTERYCVVFQTLSHPPVMSLEVKSAGA